MSHPNCSIAIITLEWPFLHGHLASALMERVVWGQIGSELLQSSTVAKFQEVPREGD